MAQSSSFKVISNSIIYTIGGLVTKCFAFFLLPLYTTYLSPADYGLTSIVSTFLCISSFLVSFSTYSSVLRFYVEYKDDEKLLKEFYGTIFLFIFCSGIIIGGILFIFQRQLVDYVFAGVDFFPIVFVSLISMIFNCTHTFFETILRSQQQAAKATCLSVLYFVINAILTIVLVVYYGLGAYGVVLAMLIAGLVYTLYMVLEMIRSKTIGLCFHFDLLRDALKYSIPIIPHNISPHIALMVQKVLISNNCSLSVLGIYSVAAQFGSLADTVQIYVNQAYGPWLFEKLSLKAVDKKEIGNVTSLLAKIIGGLFLMIALYAQDYIFLFINDKYVSAWRYIPFIICVFSIKTIYYFYVNILFYHKNAARILFIATLTSSLFSIVLAFVLIPNMGAIGAVVADCVSMIVQIALIITISSRYDDIGLDLRTLLLNILMISIFTFIGFLPSLLYFRDAFSLYNVILKTLVIVIYFLMIMMKYKQKMFDFLTMIKN